MKKCVQTTRLFETELRHLFDSEHQSYDFLALLSSCSESPELKAAFRQHQSETLNQISRLLKVYGIMGLDPDFTTIQSYEGIGEKGREILRHFLDRNFTDRSKGMEGIISEGKEFIRHFGDTEVANLALCSSADKMMSFEIAGYLQLIKLARLLENQESIALFKQTLNEEAQFKEKLQLIANQLTAITA